MRRSIAVFVVLLSSAPISRADARPVSKGLLGPIIFESDRSGRFQIYRMTSGGKNVHRLTNEPVGATTATWGPTAERNGARRIAFESVRNGNTDIYSITQSKRQVLPMRLTEDAGKDLQPDWSPDGTKIAFTSDRDDGRPHVYVMDADGSNEVALTQGQAKDEAPAWSPDGTKIAFTRFLGVGALYVMDADGSNPTQLSSGLVAFPSWSLDGSKIAFSRAHSIVVLDLTSMTETYLTSGEGFDDAPAWALGRIAFLSFRDGDAEIYTMRSTDGSDVRRLTHSTATDGFPDW